MQDRISIHNADGSRLGSLSPLAFQALVESGLLHDERKPAPVEITRRICIGEGCYETATIAIFCRECFERIEKSEPEFAAAWHGSDWWEACKLAAQEVRV